MSKTIEAPITEEVVKIDPVVEKIPETVVESSSQSDSEPDFFANADKPREKYETPDPEPTADGEADKGQPTISQTSAEDEQYFKLAMGLIDNNRAILLSLYVAGDMEHVDKYVYYKDWADPKHKPILEAGRVVASKYKFSAFKYLPEACLILAVVISSAVLFSIAKKDKKALQGAAATDHNHTHAPAKQEETVKQPTKLKKVV